MALDALLAAAGAPWYAAILEEAGLGCVEALRCDNAAHALADAGVEPRHAEAILAQLARDDAAAAAAVVALELPAVSQAGAAAATTSGAACAAFTRGGLYCPAFLAAVAPLYEQHMGAGAS
jgi:hypothetical protein